MCGSVCEGRSSGIVQWGYWLGDIFDTGVQEGGCSEDKVTRGRARRSSIKTVIRTKKNFLLPPQVTIEQPDFLRSSSKNLIFYDLPSLKSAKNEEAEKQVKQLLANYLRRPENVPVVLHQAKCTREYDAIQDSAVNVNYSDLAPRPDWVWSAIFLVGTRIFFSHIA